MLKLGLSGGIGSGKSTVSMCLRGMGAVVVDADQIAREILAAGTEGLSRVAEVFGRGVLQADGALDRPFLANIVFADERRRRELEAITHPLIEARTAELFAGAAPGDVVVHDVPLLVEKDMWDAYHLVLIVDVDAERRVRRLVESRGMTADDAQARIQAQATDEQRRAAADVVLDNNGEPSALEQQVHDLWERRLAPYAANLAARRPALTEHPTEPTIRTWARLRRLGNDHAAAGFFPLGDDGMLGSADPGDPVRLPVK